MQAACALELQRRSQFAHELAADVAAWPVRRALDVCPDISVGNCEAGLPAVDEDAARHIVEDLLHLANGTAYVSLLQEQPALGLENAVASPPAALTALASSRAEALEKQVVALQREIVLLHAEVYLRALSPFSAIGAVGPAAPPASETSNSPHAFGLAPIEEQPSPSDSSPSDASPLPGSSAAELLLPVEAPPEDPRVQQLQDELHTARVRCEGLELQVEMLRRNAEERRVSRVLLLLPPPPPSSPLPRPCLLWLCPYWGGGVVTGAACFPGGNGRAGIGDGQVPGLAHLASGRRRLTGGGGGLGGFWRRFRDHQQSGWHRHPEHQCPDIVSQL